MPEGLLVVGDAHCRFDPVFGQGVSVAAMEAHQLQLLLQGKNNLIKHLHNNFIKGSYYNRNTLGYDNNGNITSSSAKRELTIKQKFQLWYTKQIYQLSATDSDVYIRLVKVMNLIRSPFHLFHPKVLFAVLLKQKIAGK